MGDVVLGEGLVEHNLVQPVEELGPEGVVQQIVDGIFRLGGDVALLIDASSRYWDPRLEVRMMMVFLKSTVRP